MGEVVCHKVEGFQMFSFNLMTDNFTHSSRPFSHL